MSSADLVALLLCGDVMTGRGIDQILPRPSDPRLCESYAASAADYVGLAERAHGPIPRPVAPAYVWGAALEALARARPDLGTVNLETAVTTSDDCVAKGVNYRMHPANVACLAAAGIDCCVLANNHVLDWGRAGLVETLATLEGAGIRTAGAGCDRAAAAAPAVLEAAGKGRVLVFAYGTAGSGIPPDWAAEADRPGINYLAEPSMDAAHRIAEAVSAVRRPGDVVVVSVHWGGNWGYQVPEAQRRFAHRLIDAGAADVIHGHSSHHAKAIEVYRDRLILYGCGDVLNDYEGIGGYQEYRGDLALMYLARIVAGTGELAGLTLMPFRMRKFSLERPPAEDIAWLASVLGRECRRFGTRIAARDGYDLVLGWD